MLCLIGLGLNENGISQEGLRTLQECQKVYLENYTVDFPYSLEELETSLKSKIQVLVRGEVEEGNLIQESEDENIALLVYGCPLFATTHMTLIMDAKKAKVKIKIIYAASIFDAIAETGLQLYKFGKISSMPAWQKNYTPDSFLDFVKENRGINAHSLILVDIGLKFGDALKQLGIASKNKKVEINEIIVCSNLGTEKAKVLYGGVGEMKEREVRE